MHKYFQVFSLDYRKALFPEEVFMAHSWQRRPNTSMLWRILYILFPHVLHFVQPSSPSPPTFTSTVIFHVLLLWLKSDRAIFDVIFWLIILWIYTYLKLVPWCQKDLAKDKASCLLRTNTLSGFLLVLWQGVTQKFWEDGVLMALGKTQVCSRPTNSRSTFQMQLELIKSCDS